MPNIYTRYVDKDECHSLNCTPEHTRYGGTTYRKGEVLRCSHGNIYFCTSFVRTLDTNPWKHWKKLSPWLNPFKYDKADRLLKRVSVQTEQDSIK
jgi:hypothetical protein